VDVADGGSSEPGSDFFVSYTESDKRWAVWIAHTLEEAGYRTQVQAWDSTPGMHFVDWMQRVILNSERTIAVLSAAYARSTWGAAEWQAAWAADPTGRDRKLLVARVEDCERPGLLAQVGSFDLFGRDEGRARGVLLDTVALAISGERARPEDVAFPDGPSVFPVRLPPVWNLPGPGAEFVGRDGVMDQIDAGFARRPTVSLTGMAGIGKTTAALEYARRHPDGLDAVWLVPGEHPERIGELAPRLGLSEHSGPEAVVDRLSTRGGRWLVILDGAPGPDAVPDWLRPGGDGQLLITSRDPAWGSLAVPVPVGPLERPESVTLLRNLAPGLDPALASRFAARLGDHPYALRHTGEAIEARREPDGFYQAMLDRLDAGTPAPDVSYLRGSPEPPWAGPMAELLGDSLRRVDAEAPDEARLLRLVALGGQDRLTARVLTAGPNATGAEFFATGAAAGRLERRSLVLWDREGISMHPLTRDAVLAAMTPGETASLTAELARRLRAAQPDTIGGDPATWPRWRELLLHTRAVLSHSSAGGGDGGGEDAAWLAERAAVYLNDTGQSAEAVTMAERAVPIRERLHGPDHPETLASRYILAQTLLESGRVGDACELAGQVLADRERVLGPSHPDTLDSRHVLAVAERAYGRPLEAIARLEAVLADREEIQGRDHPGALASRHELGVSYSEAGDSSRGIQLLRDAAEGRHNLLDADHPATLDSWHALGVAYRRLGATDEAAHYLNRALTGRSDIIGPDHPKTLDSHHQLGIAYRQGGRTDDAIREFGQTLVERERILGSSHPKTLDSVHELGVSLLRSGRPAEATPLLERELDARVAGPDPADTWKVRLFLADGYEAQGRPEAAIPHIERVVGPPRVENLPGDPDEPRVSETRDRLVTLYRDSGLETTAVPHAERVLADRGGRYGNDDDRTLAAADRLIALFRASKDPHDQPRAAELSKLVLGVREYKHGPGHPDVLNGRLALAGLYGESGRPREAAGEYARAREDAIRQHGPLDAAAVDVRQKVSDGLAALGGGWNRSEIALPEMEPRPYRPPS